MRCSVAKKNTNVCCPLLSGSQPPANTSVHANCHTPKKCQTSKKCARSIYYVCDESTNSVPNRPNAICPRPYHAARRTPSQGPLLQHFVAVAAAAAVVAVVVVVVGLLLVVT